MTKLWYYDTTRRSDIVIDQGFLLGGCASPGGVNYFQGERALTRSTKWKVFKRKSVPSNLLI